MEKRKQVVFDINPELHKQFKCAVILNGATMRREFERFMREYVEGDKPVKAKQS